MHIKPFGNVKWYQGISMSLTDHKNSILGYKLHVIIQMKIIH